MKSNVLARRAFNGALAAVLAFGTCVPATAAFASEDLAAAETAAASTEAIMADDTFTFSDDGIAQAGSTNKVAGCALTINTPGTYLVTGSCSEGSIKVKKGTTGVSLILQDLSLTSASGAPLVINKDNGDVTVQVVGTVALTDNENADDENSTDEAVADAFEGAAIKVKSGSNLLITGTGTLTVDGSACKNAIKGGAESVVAIGSGSTDAVKVVANAAKNGIASDGNVTVNGGTVTVKAGNDGIKSQPDEDDAASAGTVTINGGTLDITSAGDGVQATNELTVNGGSVSIVANGGSTTAHMSDADSCKGLKSDKLVQVNGGTFDLDTADDCIHSDGDINLVGGSFTLKTHDKSTKPDNMSSSQASTTVYEKGGDAVHADYVTTIGAEGVTAAPVITVEKCYEGIEGAEVNVTGGTVRVVAQDDGINAANSDLTDYSYKVAIAGGDVLVNAAGDGIDSNGTAELNGGKVEVYSSGGAEEAIDCDGTWAVSDTELLAVGGVGADWKAPASGVYVNFGASGSMGGMGQGGFGGDQQGGMGQGGFGGDQQGGMGQGGFGGDQQGAFNASSQRRFGPMSTDEVEGAENTEGGQSAVETQATGMPGGGFGEGAGSGASIISGGQTIVIADSSNNTLYSTTAAGSGTTAFFAHPALVSGDTYTMAVNGATTYQGSAIEGSSAAVQPGQGGMGEGAFPGSDGAQPGALPGNPPSDMTSDAQAPGQAVTQPETGTGVSGDVSNPTAGESANAGSADTVGSAANVEAGSNAADEQAGSEASAEAASNVARRANTMKVAVNAKAVSSARLANAAKTVKALKVTKAKGTVKYTRVSGSKCLKVNAKTGKITIVKGTQAGTYKVKVKVRAAGNGNFKAKTVTKVVTVTVR